MYDSHVLPVDDDLGRPDMAVFLSLSDRVLWGIESSKSAKEIFFGFSATVPESSFFFFKDDFRLWGFSTMSSFVDFGLSTESGFVVFTFPGFVTSWRHFGAWWKEWLRSTPDLTFVLFSKEPFLKSLGDFFISVSTVKGFLKSTVELLTLRCFSQPFLSLEVLRMSFGDTSVSWVETDSPLCSWATIGKPCNSSKLSLCLNLGLSPRRLTIEPKLDDGVLASILWTSDFARNIVLWWFMSATDFRGLRMEWMYSRSPTHNASSPSKNGLFPPFLAAMGACSLLMNEAAMTVARNEDDLFGESLRSHLLSDWKQNYRYYRL